MLKSKIKKAFTLIELLIVVAIIGILAAAVIFGVSNARNKAAQSRAMSDCNSFITAAQAAFAETGTATSITDTVDYNCDSNEFGGVDSVMSFYLPRGLLQPTGCTANYWCRGTYSAPLFSATCGNIPVNGVAGGCQ